MTFIVIIRQYRLTLYLTIWQVNNHEYRRIPLFPAILVHSVFKDFSFLRSYSKTVEGDKCLTTRRLLIEQLHCLRLGLKYLHIKNYSSSMSIHIFFDAHFRVFCSVINDMTLSWLLNKLYTVVQVDHPKELRNMSNRNTETCSPPAGEKKQLHEPRAAVSKSSHLQNFNPAHISLQVLDQFWPVKMWHAQWCAPQSSPSQHL